MHEFMMPVRNGFGALFAMPNENNNMHGYKQPQSERSRWVEYLVDNSLQIISMLVMAMFFFVGVYGTHLTTETATQNDAIVLKEKLEAQAKLSKDNGNQILTKLDQIAAEQERVRGLLPLSAKDLEMAQNRIAALERNFDIGKAQRIADEQALALLKQQLDNTSAEVHDIYNASRAQVGKTGGR